MLENIVLNRLQIGTNSLYVFAFFYREKKKPNKKKYGKSNIQKSGIL